MTIQDMLEMIAFRLGNRKGMENQILREVQLAQSRLEKDPKVDWWFLQKQSNFTIGPSVPFPQLPADYERLVDQTVLLLSVVGQSNYKKLARAYQEDALVDMGSHSDPTYYSLIGKVVAVFPPATVDYTIGLTYIAREPLLSTAVDAPISENQWTKEAFALLMCKAGIALAQALQNKDALGNFVADYNAAYSEAFTESFARSDINFSQVRD
jgi:hypothetical protein